MLQVANNGYQMLHQFLAVLCCIIEPVPFFSVQNSMLVKLPLLEVAEKANVQYLLLNYG